MATDIAFVVGFLALLGSRVPVGLKILLLSLAIADDIGAVLVIAVVYTSNLDLSMLGLAAAGLAVTILFDRIGVRAVGVYVLIGVFIWLGFVQSGVHPTVAGVLLGLLTPTREGLDDETATKLLNDTLDPNHRSTHEEKRALTMARAASIVKESVSPLERLETVLHPWVSFVIMPIFALANAGVAIGTEAIGHSVSLAVAAGLFFGKPLGIVLFSWVAVKMGIANLPRGVNWRVMIGAGALAGIGFTMALFIAALALPESLLDAGKIGILIGSLASAIAGSALLILFLPRKG